MNKWNALALVACGIFATTALLGSSTENMSRNKLSIGGSTIDVETIDGAQVSINDILDWVRKSAHAVTVYYGHFPVSYLNLRIRIDDRAGIHSGKTFATDEGGRITIKLGRSFSKSELNDDWMLTHEMVHLAFPDMEEQHHWIEEGLATYIEPWARVQAGDLSAQKVWSDLVRDMPQGLPEAGDKGLDRTPTWGRIYWGGALYCLLADVEIRQRTHNKKGLRDALRAINHQVNISDEMEITDVLKLGDQEIGMPVLVELYQKMATNPSPIDLNELWKKLGIRIKDGSVGFDPNAPLADIRRGIERG